MKSKQEKIQEAYGEHWESVKEFVDENGWCSNCFSLRDGYFYFHNQESGKEFWRPSSLSGIENNNGWIDPLKSGLPQKSCNVFFLEILVPENTSITEMHIGWWNNKLGRFTSYDNSEKYLFDEITYYKTIDEPHPPLY